MPVIFFRVVCGLCVTIESLQSSSALSRVDLPAFGGPMMLVNPQEKDGAAAGMGERVYGWNIYESERYYTKLRAVVIMKNLELEWIDEKTADG